MLVKILIYGFACVIGFYALLWLLCAVLVIAVYVAGWFRGFKG